MRLRILLKPTGLIDGIRLDDLVVGYVYDVGTTLGCYLLAERLAEPADDAEVTEAPPWNDIHFDVVAPVDTPTVDRTEAAIDQISEAADRSRRKPPGSEGA